MKDSNHNERDYLLINDHKDSIDEFSTSHLPSRKEIHGRKKTKIKWKIKFPLIKLLGLLFILLPITIMAIFYSLSDDESSASSKDSGYNEEIPNITMIGSDSEEKQTKVEIEEDNEENINQEAVTEQEEKIDITEDTAKKENNQTEAEAAKAETTTVESSETKEETKEEIKEQSSTSTEDGYDIVEHVVKANETIFRISMNYYSSQDGIELIKEWNGLSNNTLKVGQVLKIPLKK